MADLSWWEWLAVIAGAVTAVGIIWRQGIRPIAHGVKRAAHAVDIVQEAVPPLLEIVKTFRANGGGSLPETLARMDATLTERTATFEAMREESAELHEEVRFHIRADSEAFALIGEAQALAADTATKMAVALKVETEETAAALRVKTEETAVSLKAKNEEIAAALKAKTEETAVGVHDELAGERQAVKDRLDNV